MSDLQKDIARMGFDAEMAHNLSEIVRITREATIEECATNLSFWYPDNVNTNAFCAALKSMKASTITQAHQYVSQTAERGTPKV